MRLLPSDARSSIRAMRERELNTLRSLTIEHIRHGMDPVQAVLSSLLLMDMTTRTQPECTL